MVSIFDQIAAMRPSPNFFRAESRPARYNAQHSDNHPESGLVNPVGKVVPGIKRLDLTQVQIGQRYVSENQTLERQIADTNSQSDALRFPYACVRTITFA